MKKVNLSILAIMFNFCGSLTIAENKQCNICNQKEDFCACGIEQKYPSLDWFIKGLIDQGYYELADQLISIAINYPLVAEALNYTLNHHEIITLGLIVKMQEDAECF